MLTDTQKQDNESTLLGYVDLCFSVALTLTKDKAKATALTERVVLWAWRERLAPDWEANLKTELLQQLRHFYRMELANEKARAALATLPPRKPIQLPGKQASRGWNYLVEAGAAS